MNKTEDEISIVQGEELAKLLEDAPVRVPAIMVGAYVGKGPNENFPQLGEVCTLEAILQVKGVGLAVMPFVLDLALAESLGLKENPTIEEGK